MSRNFFIFFNIYQVYRNTLLKNEINFVLMRLKKQAGPSMQRKDMFTEGKLRKLLIMTFAYHWINVNDSILLKKGHMKSRGFVGRGAYRT
jgi:hypothetical protein